MEAVLYPEHGDRSVIDYGTYPDPEPGPEEVLVDVKAAALNHLDIWTRRGMPHLELELPHVPGSDMAGEVLEVGDRVGRFAPGDRVALAAALWCGECAACRRGDRSMCVDFGIIGEHTQGVHAELAAIPADNLVPVPEGVPWETAAAVPLVFQTAWRLLITRAELREGESVLVLGASGGVGHAAVQIAAHAGAEVFATASTPEKLEHARELGADHTIDYTEVDFADAVRERTDGRGVDVVLDHIAGETWDGSLRSLRKGGRLVTCGATGGFRPETHVNRVFTQQLSIIGSMMAEPGEVDDVLALVWDGTFQPRLRDTLPMSEAARGHQLLEDREGFGKVVLVPDSELEA